ncbi:hypothetical protein ACODM8_12700 [Vibrio ostreicida]|uniref:hypothetical protein n=1 Tax=Vibrio ostreicida TaxID=526588 RepID=UPI003B5B95DB
MIDFLEGVETGRHDWYLNACVGNNGRPTQRTYATGFLIAAQSLLDERLLEETSPDYMVYPICFNIRHGIELSIKQLISELIELHKMRGEHHSFDYAGSHDLGIIWEKYTSLVLGFDDRLDGMTIDLSKLVNPWAKIDPTGQTFRYAFSNQSIKHLTEYSTIDLGRVGIQLSSLKDAIAKHFDLFTELENEYKLNTYTAKLSRYNLLQLAKELPLRKNWGKDEFLTVKSTWMRHKNLTNREFSRACDKILENRELSYEIGIELPLRAASDDDILWVMNLWLSYQKAINTSDSTKPTPNSILDFNRNRSSWLAENEKEIFEFITQPLVSDIHSLYYSGDMHSYSEEYDFTFDNELQNAKTKDEQLFDEFMHVFRKRTFANQITYCLSLVGKMSLVNQLLLNSEISEHIHSKDKIRAREFRTKHYSEWYETLVEPDLTVTKS